MSLMERLAACSASDSDSEPMMIMRPDLKTKMVLLGLVLRMITAGNRFLLQRLPSTFQAISFRSRSFSMFIFAKETTFCTNGRFGCSWIFSMASKKINKKVLISTCYKYFFQAHLLWVSKQDSSKKDLFSYPRRTQWLRNAQETQNLHLASSQGLWGTFQTQRLLQKCNIVKLRTSQSAFYKN